MQVILLCGGKGTRLSEYTDDIPKPLVTVGNKPILHHLMDYYAKHGHTDFILCLGYKGDQITEYLEKNKDPSWNITFKDTGEDTSKAQRLLRVKDEIKDDTFFVSYGDDLSDVDLNKLLEFHEQHGKIVTLTAVPLQSPFGILEVNENDEIIQFKEKPKLHKFMNGGFYVMNRAVFGHIKQDYDLEKETFSDLVNEIEIVAFKHDGFWKSMNTLKDVNELNSMYNAGDTPWIK